MYRYAIIGFGGLGKKHFSNLIALEKERGDFSLCAICGTDSNAFNESVKLNLGDVDMSSVNFSNYNFYQDYKRLIEKEKPDFIISTLPTYLHEEATVYCLNHGVHVFSEKPMATSEKQCENMINASIKNNKKLMIGQCLRFEPAYNQLKEYIEKGTFGNAYRAEFKRYSQTPTWSWNNWILNPDFGGGCVLDMHIHDVDLINWFFGRPNAVFSSVTEKKHALESICTQYFYDDLLVTANADWSMPQTFPFEAYCMVNFEEATLVLKDGKITVYQDNKSFLPALLDKDCFVEEMKAFLKWVIDDEECRLTSPESVMEAVKLALCEVRAAKERRRMILD